MDSKLEGLCVENKYEKLIHHTKSISNILKTNSGLMANKIEINNNGLNKNTNGKEKSSKNSFSNISEDQNQSSSDDEKRIHRVVFTGGPCAGKTTSINRIKTFFENIGWKVLSVPETATTLLSSGIFFAELDENAKLDFQENLLKTLLQIEDTINETAKNYATKKNVIIIYDRGAMDPISYIAPHEWEILKIRNPSWNEVDLRDNRYDQIIHLVTAANGAEQFYTLENNNTRTESIELARELDEKCAKTWVGHPCMDVIGNSTVFDTKVTKALQTVCERVGLNLKGFDAGNRKRKFLVKQLPDDSLFPNLEELTVIHNYLVSSSDAIQVRIRKSGKGGNWSYSYAIRTYEDGLPNETRTQIDRREYAVIFYLLKINSIDNFNKDFIKNN